eukprot:876496_1
MNIMRYAQRLMNANKGWLHPKHSINHHSSNMAEIVNKDALRDCKYTEYKEPILTIRPLPTGCRTRSVKGNEIKYKPSSQATQTKHHHTTSSAGQTNLELLQIIGC